MTLRQSLLKSFYPVIMMAGKLAASKKIIVQNKINVIPPVSFYDLRATDISSKTIRFNDFSGKKLLLVNTASDCGFTAQYEELEKLYNRFPKIVTVIGFPSNDFKNQEKGSNKDIENFCRKNYGVTFPLMQKSTVIKSEAQHEVFQWLTNKSKNGWNSKAPEWNFCKYLIDENGMLIYYFDSKISPLNKKVLQAVSSVATIKTG